MIRGLDCTSMLFFGKTAKSFFYIGWCLTFGLLFGHSMVFSKSVSQTSRSSVSLLVQKSGLHCSVRIGRFYTALDFSQFCLRLIRVWQKVLTFRVLHINFLLWGFILIDAFLQTVEWRQFLRFFFKKQHETIKQLWSQPFFKWTHVFFSTEPPCVFLETTQGFSNFIGLKRKFFHFFGTYIKTLNKNSDIKKFWKVTGAFPQLFWLLLHVNSLKK